MKKIFTLLLACAVLLSACGNSQTSGNVCTIENCGNEVYKDGLCPDHYVEKKSSDEKDSMKEQDFSTAENDTDIGLKNIKFDTTQGELTETEKLVAEYFNNDYLFVNSTEALQRYNKIFDNALIQSYVYVEKVISYEEDDFVLLVDMINNSSEFYFQDYMTSERQMIISGTSGDARVIVGDILQINGRYQGVKSETVDGVSITVPYIDVHRAYWVDLEDEDSWWYVEKPSRFTMLEVKEIAKCIFGEDITIRKDEPADYGVPSEEYYGSELEGYSGPCYVCELDNQTNSKFSRYFFNQRMGTLKDAVHPNYELSFSGDFKHFYLFMYDEALESLTLEYYDSEFNKLWKREFEGTISASYDVTKNNIYLVANNEFYVINTETGEDTFDSTYIGNKLDIRKFKDGVLTISDQKSDAFMFVGLDGNVLWRADAVADIPEYYEIQTQQVGNSLLISVSDAYEVYYYVIDISDGTMIYHGTVESEIFQLYG